MSLLKMLLENGKMKYIRGLMITAMFFWGIATNVGAVSIDLSTYNCDTGQDCESLLVAPGSSSPSEEISRIETEFGLASGTLSLLYKDDADSGEVTAPFKDSYSTTYSNTSIDPKDVEISWDGGSSISCPECYLYVKGGNQVGQPGSTPNVFMFNLGTVADLALWDGMVDLVLTNWSGRGAISHVAIYGVSPIPVPAAFWLFGTALIGFIGFSRRTKV
jgi:hypothetical protein